MVGPGFYERWSQWKSCSPEQKSRAMARVELEKILSSDKEHGPHLTYEEVTTVRRNLATMGLDVDNELIRETWYPVFRKNFLRAALGKCYDCRKGFWMYQQVKYYRFYWPRHFILFPRVWRQTWTAGTSSFSGEFSRC